MRLAFWEHRVDVLDDAPYPSGSSHSFLRGPSHSFLRGSSRRSQQQERVLQEE